ncbi:MAG: bifunctional alpha,alpha-trehalose-phosphate synthase (UDP-forming)/trehalose-phosphatase [Bacteroidota bacterium]
MNRLVIISNRLPVTIVKENSKMVYKPSAGGLATGLNSLDDSIPRLWIGWPGIEVSNPDEQQEVTNNLDELNLIPVFLSNEEITDYYEGFSNKTIWPHFHYFTQYTKYSETFWACYQKVNHKFAKVVNSLLQEGDVVLVHDYQLLLLPKLIRAVFPDIAIGFFLHIPFPSYEIFRTLPWRKDLLEGILGADLIGFHTFGYMRHFLSAAYRITGYEHNFGRMKVGNRFINVDVFPIGIDYNKYAFPSIDYLREDSTVHNKEMARTKKIVISIDRLDYTKGILQRISAFDAFLKKYPGFVGKVTLVLVVVPSRANVEQYKDLKHNIDTMVGKINAVYRTFEWEPLLYFYRSLSFEELITLYQVADVAMISPLRDGMNLVAKEYVASKEVSKKGVLVLSEMAGAVTELGEALIVNPNDRKDQVRALNEAILMNEKEQRWRLENMQNKLKRYTVQWWANTFLSELNKLMEERKKHIVKRLDGQSLIQLFDAYKKAKNRLLILDYDGTLMHFHSDPQAVSPDPALIAMLTILQNNASNKLIINSGRDKTTLEKWMGPLEIDLAAEHGVWIKKEGKWSINPNLRSNWIPEVRNILQNVVDRTPGSFIEEKDYSIAWHYRKIDKDLGEKRVREFRDVLRYLTANADLQVLEGNKVVEVKNAGVNKGKATNEWLSDEKWDFILSIGDDRTDEDTFKALPKEAYTIKVGLDSTVARYKLNSVDEVREFLNKLKDI